MAENSVPFDENIAEQNVLPSEGVPPVVSTDREGRHQSIGASTERSASADPDFWVGVTPRVANVIRKLRAEVEELSRDRAIAGRLIVELETELSKRPARSASRSPPGSQRATPVPDAAEQAHLRQQIADLQSANAALRQALVASDATCKERATASEEAAARVGALAASNAEAHRTAAAAVSDASRLRHELHEANAARKNALCRCSAAEDAAAAAEQQVAALRRDAAAAAEAAAKALADGDARLKSVSHQLLMEKEFCNKLQQALAEASDQSASEAFNVLCSLFHSLAHAIVGALGQLRPFLSSSEGASATFSHDDPAPSRSVQVDVGERIAALCSSFASMSELLPRAVQRHAAQRDLREHGAEFGPVVESIRSFVDCTEGAMHGVTACLRDVTDSTIALLREIAAVSGPLTAGQAQYCTRAAFVGADQSGSLQELLHRFSVLLSNMSKTVVETTDTYRREAQLAEDSLVAMRAASASQLDAIRKELLKVQKLAAEHGAALASAHEADRELECCKETLKAQTADLQKTKELLAEVTRQRDDSCSMVTNATSQLRSLQNDLVHLRAEDEALRQDACELRSNVQVCVDALPLLLSTIEALKRDLEECNAACAACRADTGSLEADVSSLRLCYGEAESDVARMLSQIAAYEAHFRDSAEASGAATEMHHAQHIERERALQGGIASLHSVVEGYKQQLQQVELERNALRAAISQFAAHPEMAVEFDPQYCTSLQGDSSIAPPPRRSPSPTASSAKSGLSPGLSSAQHPAHETPRVDTDALVASLREVFARREMTVS